MDLFIIAPSLKLENYTIKRWKKTNKYKYSIKQIYNILKE